MLQKYLSDCEEYDEVSLNSETTLASEFVERQIAHFDNDLQNDFPANSDINRRVQVNLQVVESLNIYRENEANEEGNESVQLKTISEITQAITQAVVLNRHEDQQNEYLLNRKKFFFGGFLTIMSLTLLVLTVFIAFSARDKQVLDNNKPKLAKPVELIFSRNKWIQDLGRIGSKHLKTHLKKVILFEKTLKQSSSCQEETCSDVAGNFYPNFEDLRENFVIATDGTIFEARGFDRESEAAFDDFGTSYNNDAISISILLENDQTNVNEAQLKSLRKFIQTSVKSKKLEQNFFWILFHNLSKKLQFDESLLKLLKSLTTTAFEEVPLESLEPEEKSANLENVYNLFSCERKEILVGRSKDHDNIDTFNRSMNFEKFHIVLFDENIRQLRSFDCVSGDERFGPLKILVLSNLNEENDDMIIKGLKKVEKQLLALGKLSKMPKFDFEDSFGEENISRLKSKLISH